MCLSRVWPAGLGRSRWLLHPSAQHMPNMIGAGSSLPAPCASAEEQQCHWASAAASRLC